LSEDALGASSASQAPQEKCLAACKEQAENSFNQNATAKMKTNVIERLAWPSKTAECINTDSGWTLVDTPSEKTLHLWKTPASCDSAPAVIVSGHRNSGMRVLTQCLPNQIQFLYFDFPRLLHFVPKIETLRYSTWLTLVRSHLELSLPLLKDGGAIACHVDEEGGAYVQAILDEVLSPQNRVTTIVWQKKYAPQNDLKGHIDDGHDYIFVYSNSPNSATALRAKCRDPWWTHAIAGKTEDATREFQALQSEGVVTLSDLPKTSKPAKLVTLLLERFTFAKDWVAEVFSDTGFASIASVACGRRPILFAGCNTKERQLLELCGEPSLLHQFQKKGLQTSALIKLDANTKTDFEYKESKLSSKNGNVVVYLPVKNGTANSFTQSEAERLFQPVIFPKESQAGATTSLLPSFGINGDIVASLTSLEPVVRCRLKLVWADFLSSASSPAFSQEFFNKVCRAVPHILSADGVFAVRIKDSELASAKLALDAVFGKQQHVGTIVAQSKEIIGEMDPFSIVLLYRPLPMDKLQKLGLPSDYAYNAEDGDPRGPWRNPGHKGARSGGRTTAFGIRVPPYRWKLVGGSLPPGCWRLNEQTGVIWAKALRATGKFFFKVLVADSHGRSSTANCQMEVRATGDFFFPDNVWWQTESQLKKSDKAPQIQSVELPSGVVGRAFAFVLEANGGQPFDEIKKTGKETGDGRRTRYWDFNKANLVKSTLEDRVSFGSTGQANPSFKYYPDPTAAKENTVELSWWDKERLGAESISERLLRIFVKDQETVLEVFGGLEGGLWTKTNVSTISLFGDRTAPASYCHPVGSLASSIAKHSSSTRHFSLQYDSAHFREGLAWLEGFLPLRVQTRFKNLPAEKKAHIIGASAEPDDAFLMLSKTSWPTHRFCAEVTTMLSPLFRRLFVYYFRGEPPNEYKQLHFRRIPFELACKPKSNL